MHGGLGAKMSNCMHSCCGRFLANLYDKCRQMCNTNCKHICMQVSGPTSQPFVTAISDDKSGVRKSKDQTFDAASPPPTESAPSSSTGGSQISSSRSCASFADDRSGSYNGSTTGGGSSSSSASSPKQSAHPKRKNWKGE